MKRVTCRDWFASRQYDHGVVRYWEPYVDPLFRSNFWHVRGKDRDLIVDAGMGLCRIRPHVPELNREDMIAVATHSHIDHIGGLHEFDTRVAHPLEASRIEAGLRPISLRIADWPETTVQALRAGGYPLAEELVTAYPCDDFDSAAVGVDPVEVTRTVKEGDSIDLGDRTFTVLHLPGHSPGSIGLLEAERGILFSGDAIYDGPLLDELPGCSIPDYITTMERLRSLDVTVVHAGHDESFGPDRLRDLAQAYLATRRAT